MRGAKLSGWRRIASAMWDAPNDPQIYGALELEAGPLLDFMSSARAAGHHVTPTHLVGRAVAHGLRSVPDLNVRLRNGRAITRPSVEVFFLTAVEGGHDLSGVKIENADEKSAIEVSRELDLRSRILKQKRTGIIGMCRTLPRPRRSPQPPAVTMPPAPSAMRSRRLPTVAPCSLVSRLGDPRSGRLRRP